jgi:hypothetical protein
VPYGGARIALRVELTPQQVSALGAELGKRVVLRADVRAWADRVVRAALAELGGP